MKKTKEADRETCMSSVHYSAYNLNTWRQTPYFRAHCPDGYEVTFIMQHAKAFRHLPPGLRSLCDASRSWALAQGAEPGNAYDEEGYELDLCTGKRLRLPPPPATPLADITVPAGGWPDPRTWQSTPEDPEPEERYHSSPGQIRSDVASRGVARTAHEYDLSEAELVRLLTTYGAVSATKGTDFAFVVDTRSGAVRWERGTWTAETEGLLVRVAGLDLGTYLPLSVVADDVALKLEGVVRWVTAADSEEGAVQ